MNTHSIDLFDYYARSRGSSTIYLGTAGSHGNEQLQVTQGKGWEGLTVQVVFHPSKVAVQLPANGLLDVPWEATTQPLTSMQGRIVFQGFDQDRLVNSTDLAYTVASHSPAVGRDEEPYTPGIVEGVLNLMAADKNVILQAAQQTGQAKEAAATSAAEAESSAANAQQSAGAANTSAGQASDSANQAADSAVAAGETLTQVQTAGREAQQKVKDAETTALDKIAAAAPALPAVSDGAAWKSVTVKSDGTGYDLAALAPIEAAIRPTVTGNPAICENSAEWGLQGLKIYGKSVQNGTPSPESPSPIASVGDNGQINLDFSGTQQLKNQSVSSYYINSAGTLAGRSTSSDFSKILSPIIGQTYYFKRSNPGTRFRVACVPQLPINAPIGTVSCVVKDTSTKLSLKADTGYVIINLESEKAFEGFTVSLQNYAGYQDYQSQSLTLSTPFGLPGIPVKSGSNYTDAEGQQWICDIIDNALNQNLVKLVFDGSSDEDWLLQSINSYNIANFRIVLFRDICEPENEIRFISNRFVGQITSIADTKTEGILIAAGNTLYIRIKSERASTVSDFRAWLNANNVEVLIPRVTPIVTPFSDEELTAYCTLKTYTGTTVVSTAEPIAGMKVQYVADSTKYVEKVQSMEFRLAALEAAQTGI